ncbi:hypothetical protein GOODEAATRI_005979 [Goodea atripinnis]|uniref:Uncharacterized protein n=1 Tax=Goodea atripinnis TaxID=208336 RepID=A0ABV0PBT1_9TELE
MTSTWCDDVRRTHAHSHESRALRIQNDLVFSDVKSVEQSKPRTPATQAVEQISDMSEEASSQLPIPAFPNGFSKLVLISQRQRSGGVGVLKGKGGRRGGSVSQTTVSGDYMTSVSTELSTKTQQAVADTQSALQCSGSEGRNGVMEEGPYKYIRVRASGDAASAQSGSSAVAGAVLG